VHYNGDITIVLVLWIILVIVLVLVKRKATTLIHVFVLVIKTGLFITVQTDTPHHCWDETSSVSPENHRHHYHCVRHWQTDQQLHIITSSQCSGVHTTHSANHTSVRTFKVYSTQQIRRVPLNMEKTYVCPQLITISLEQPQHSTINHKEDQLLLMTQHVTCTDFVCIQAAAVWTTWHNNLSYCPQTAIAFCGFLRFID